MVDDRFWSKVDKRGPFAVHYLTKKPIGRCWVWTGSTTSDGYGRFRIGSRRDGSRVLAYSHRLSYEAEHGRPALPQLDHVCHRPNCVRPSHLEPVTNQTNIVRALSTRTHCKNGHPYVGENVRTVRTGTRFHRICVVCRREKNRRAYRARKEIRRG